MSSQVGVNNLSILSRVKLVNKLNNILFNISINRKQDTLEPLKSNIETIPEYISTAKQLINQQLSLTTIQPGFGGLYSKQFYNNVLNAIDNMILVDFIKNHQQNITPNQVNYTLSQSSNINLDIVLAYYSVKYPLDTTIDIVKLNAIKIELNIPN
jgi:hypothetical protein